MEVAMVYFKALSWHSPGGNEKKSRKAYVVTARLEAEM